MAKNLSSGMRPLRITLIGLAVAVAVASLLAESPGGDPVKDRMLIQDQVLYAYAYTYDGKDCTAWANLFAADAVVVDPTGTKLVGRDVIRQGLCTTRQRDVVGSTRTRHNMTNIVFDQLTAREARTRSYVLITWQKPDDQTPQVQSAFTYRDVIVKQDDGKWRFKERVFSND